MGTTARIIWRRLRDRFLWPTIKVRRRESVQIALPDESIGQWGGKLHIIAPRQRGTGEQRTTRCLTLERGPSGFGPEC